MDTKYFEKNQELTSQIESFEKERLEIDAELKANRDTFKKWIEEKFGKNNVSFDSTYVEISDKKFHYGYKLEDDVLKMKKRPRRSHFGCFHPMQAFFMMLEEKEREMEETFYEGGIVPETKKDIELYETLKEDIINKGEISTAIKKYIGEDRLKRVELEKRLNDISSKKYTSADEKFRNTNNFYKQFNPEVISDYCKSKKTIVTDNNIELRNKVVSMTFIKETAKQYNIELTYDGDKKDVTKVNKNKFSIRDYITLK